MAKAVGIGAATGAAGGFVASRLYGALGTLGANSIAQTAFNAKASLFLANFAGGGLSSVLSNLVEAGELDPLETLVSATVAGGRAPAAVGSEVSAVLRAFFDSAVGQGAIEASRQVNYMRAGC